ncbi:MAG: hypothetical protein KDD40_07440, partial [Bdellovibrionales bacterium]|nr:hypothetical protein [Bdellovibrionales bacterium]
MCGILGIFGNEATKYLNPNNDILKSLKHRGPDMRGDYISDTADCYLGHTRLSIVDLSAQAKQPMQGQKGTLVYNGEVYNHLDLRKKMTGEWYSHSDTATLLKGLEDIGFSFLNQLEGMFAGAYYEPQLKRLSLFRDTLGIKPLYYCIFENHLFFASEIKAILQML